MSLEKSKAKTQKAALKELSQFLADISVSQFPGHGRSTCTKCGEDPEYDCDCEPCEKCEEQPNWCNCNASTEKPLSYDELLKQAEEFATKWSIPFDAGLHKKTISNMRADGNSIWNSSSAFC